MCWVCEAEHVLQELPDWASLAALKVADMRDIQYLFTQTTTCGHLQ